MAGPIEASEEAPGSVKYFLAVFVPSAVILAAIALVFYGRDVRTEEAIHRQRGRSIVHLQCEIIAREFRLIESDLRYLSEQGLLQGMLETRRAARDELAREYLLFCREKGLYDQIRFLDETGREIIRVNDNHGRPIIVPNDQLQSKSTRYYFRQAMALGPRELFQSPFDLNVEHGSIERPLKPVIRFAAPIFDREGRKRGILVLNYLGARLLGKLEETAAGFPGEVMLLNDQGYWLRGPRPEDEWGFMLGTERSFARAHSDPWGRISGAARGGFLAGDALYVFKACTAPTARSAPPLRVVARIPRSVLFAHSHQLLGRLLVLYAFSLALLSVLALFLARAWVQRRIHLERIGESESRLRALSTQLIHAQERERRSISRDLHDDLGQLVTVISLDLQQAVRGGDCAARERLLERALEETDRLLDRVHEISARLRPSLLDDLGLKDAVESHLTEFESRTGVTVRADLVFDREDIAPRVRENVYRILQEALTNVSKYARAEEVRVELRARADRITLTVEDRGVGFHPERLDGSTLGLLGMRERAELLGGSFRLHARPGEGTTIRVSIPLGDARRDGREEEP